MQKAVCGRNVYKICQIKQKAVYGKIILKKICKSQVVTKVATKYAKFNKKLFVAKIVKKKSKNAHLKLSKDNLWQQKQQNMQN